MPTTCRFTKLGREYMGTKSTTASGESCRTWDVSGISDPEKKFPEFHYNHNYCRSPDSAIGEPYCQRQSDGADEACDVPMCRMILLEFY